MASFAKFIPSRLRPKQARDSQKGPDAQGWLQVTVLVPLLVAAACFASALWKTAGAAGSNLWTLPVWEGGAVAAATWLAAWYSLLYSVRGLAWLPGIFAIGCLCGALVASLGYATAQWYSSPTGLIRPLPGRVAGGDDRRPYDAGRPRPGRRPANRTFGPCHRRLAPRNGGAGWAPSWPSIRWPR
jgi:hypothetical protein